MDNPYLDQQHIQRIIQLLPKVELPSLLMFQDALEERFAVLRDELDGYYFPWKCCRSAELKQLVREWNFGFDCASLSEYHELRGPGTPSSKFSICGAGLEPAAIEYFATQKCRFIANSPQQLRSYLEADGRRLGIRIAPHRENTGFVAGKFGLTLSELEEFLREGTLLPEVLHMHGSWAGFSPADAAEAVVDGVGAYLRLFPDVLSIDIGGGASIQWNIEELRSYVRLIKAGLRERFGWSGRLEAEIGEWTVITAGWLASRIVDVRTDAMIINSLYPLDIPKHRIGQGIIIRDGEQLLDETPRDFSIYGQANTSRDLLGISSAPSEARSGDVLILDGFGAYIPELTPRDFCGGNNLQRYFIEEDSAC